MTGDLRLGSRGGRGRRPRGRVRGWLEGRPPPEGTCDMSQGVVPAASSARLCCAAWSPQRPRSSVFWRSCGFWGEMRISTGLAAGAERLGWVLNRLLGVEFLMSAVRVTQACPLNWGTDPSPLRGVVRSCLSASLGSPGVPVMGKVLGGCGVERGLSRLAQACLGHLLASVGLGA